MASGYTRADVDAMADAEALSAYAFCECEQGQSLRRLRTARMNSFTRFISETRSRMIGAADQRAADLLSGAGVPRRYAEMTLATLAARANGDVAKLPAVRAAEQYMREGSVVVNGQPKRSLLVYGASGVGKTGCLAPVYGKCVRKGMTGVWLSMQELLLKMRAGFDDTASKRALSDASEADVLMIDNLGVPWRNELTAFSLDMIYILFDKRHAADAPTLMTSTLTPRQLEDQLLPQVWRRIVEMAAIIPMGGDAL